jgi:hypothetical protein
MGKSFAKIAVMEVLCYDIQENWHVNAKQPGRISTKK